MPPVTPFDLAALLIPAAGYFAIALTTDINLGYRHLLPVLPFLYVLIGVVVAWAADGGAVQRGRAGNRAALVGRVAPLLLLLWLAGATLWIHPHFLSFFNLIAGGAGQRLAGVGRQQHRLGARPGPAGGVARRERRGTGVA